MSAEARVVAPAGSFCPNEECPDFGEVDAGNLINFGHTKAGTQRRLCKTCGGTFTVTRGTIFYRRRTPQKDVVEALAQLADRGSIAAVARVKRVKEDTVSAWLRAAAAHWEALEEVLLADYHMNRAQIDALWTFVCHKGEKGGALKRRKGGRFGAAP
jgi:transposase-like protein